MSIYNYIFETKTFKIKKVAVLKALSGFYFDFYDLDELMEIFNLSDYDILKFDLEQYYFELRYLEEHGEELTYEQKK